MVQKVVRVSVKYIIVLVYIGCILYVFQRVSSNQKYRKEISNHTLDNQEHLIRIPNRQDHLTRIPHRIFMLWDKGWSKAPKLQTLCIKSFRQHNPEFELVALNLTYAENLIDRRRHYSDKAWKAAKIQAKSDIIRVELLAKYGGIWVDSSVYCNEPLHNWLNDSLLQTGFFAFERKDENVTEKNSPWISSWFLVTTKDSHIIQVWRNAVREGWAQTKLPPNIYGYYWVHRIFRNLFLNDKFFAEQYNSSSIMSANGPHCLAMDENPHVYKLKAKTCTKQRAQIIDTDVQKYRVL